jgi:hypothetical protein
MTYVLRNYGIDIAMVSYRPLEGYKLCKAMSGQETEAITKFLTG